MIKKDFTSQENIDHEKNLPQVPGETTGRNEQANPASGKTYVKNANAAGDGAFGHTETGVPDDADFDQNREQDPPY